MTFSEKKKKKQKNINKLRFIALYPPDFFTQSSNLTRSSSSILILIFSNCDYYSEPKYK